MLCWCPLSLVLHAHAQRLEAAKRKQYRAAASAGNDSDNNGDDSSDDGEDDDDEEMDEDELEARKAAEYFEDGDGDNASPAGGGTAGDASAGEGVGVGGVPFQQLNISRPLLRAVEAMGYVTPTPVQQRAVPFALAGRCVGVGVFFCQHVIYYHDDHIYYKSQNVKLMVVSASAGGIGMMASAAAGGLALLVDRSFVHQLGQACTLSWFLVRFSQYSYGFP